MKLLLGKSKFKCPDSKRITLFVMVPYAVFSKLNKKSASEKLLILPKLDYVLRHMNMINALLGINASREVTFDEFRFNSGKN